jgi:hypothetical protein
LLSAALCIGSAKIDGQPARDRNGIGAWNTEAEATAAIKRIVDEDAN